MLATWIHRVLVALLLAPASTATLSANSRLSENILDASSRQVEHGLTAALHRIVAGVGYDLRRSVLLLQVELAE